MSNYLHVTQKHISELKKEIKKLIVIYFNSETFEILFITQKDYLSTCFWKKIKFFGHIIKVRKKIKDYVLSKNLNAEKNMIDLCITNAAK